MSGFQKNDLNPKLLQGKIIYGSCITVNAPRRLNLVANANLDTEHIALDRTELSKMCFTYQVLGLTSIANVRDILKKTYRANLVV